MAGDFMAWHCCLAKHEMRRGREWIKQGRRAGWTTAPEERMPAREDLAHHAPLEMFPGLCQLPAQATNLTVPAHGASIRELSRGLFTAKSEWRH